MIFFVCHQQADCAKADEAISELLSGTDNAVVIWRQGATSKDWQERVREKISQSDFVLFLVDDNAINNPNIRWELECAESMKKPLFGIKLQDCSYISGLGDTRLMLFNDVSQCLKYAKKIHEEDRRLRIEQYKIMLDSTFCVTEQRLKVHNIFFTVSVSIISAGFIAGNITSVPTFSAGRVASC